jgi:hypothetical protein
MVNIMKGYRFSVASAFYGLYVLALCMARPALVDPASAFANLVQDAKGCAVSRREGTSTPAPAADKRITHM